MQTAGFKILKNYSPKAIENISKLLHSYKIWAIINLWHSLKISSIFMERYTFKERRKRCLWNGVIL